VAICAAVIASGALALRDAVPGDRGAPARVAGVRP